uniref:Uncharacterized protein n=1 Tax=Rhizochromulina marina TaxID=1034831 RepID=A0A7S2WF80_9STRA|mmetsp:Transcript_22869/g.66558  ORF Transcript_22869/g.66558 Transcript_22869/m.66558 type:complete len:225 (+) Transcript_22869:14-688(+)
MTAETPPVGAEKRLFVWARHGQAEHNVLIDAGMKTEGRGVLDPPLTDLGRDQAVGLQQSLVAALLGTEEGPLPPLSDLVDAVVTSPMSRALETTQAAFGSAPAVPVLVTSLHTETGVPVPGDEVAGQNCQKGSALPGLMSRFPNFDFTSVQEDGQWQCADEACGFFHPMPALERLLLFREWLEALPYQRVLVVGHSGFFKRFLGGSKMQNCQAIILPLEETRVG